MAVGWFVGLCVHMVCVHLRMSYVQFAAGRGEGGAVGGSLVAAVEKGRPGVGMAVFIDRSGFDQTGRMGTVGGRCASVVGAGHTLVGSEG